VGFAKTLKTAQSGLTQRQISQNNVPPLSGQHIEGSAGSPAVHGFDPYALANQAL
jgi:hypothetical protein